MAIKVGDLVRWKPEHWRIIEELAQHKRPDRRGLGVVTRIENRSPERDHHVVKFLASGDEVGVPIWYMEKVENPDET